MALAAGNGRHQLYESNNKRREIQVTITLDYRYRPSLSFQDTAYGAAFYCDTKNEQTEHF
jgi:hypothetical protein